MPSLLPLALQKESFTYYSEKPPDVLRNQMYGTLQMADHWDTPLNLTGEFVSDYEFVVTPKRQSTYYRGGEPKEAYIEGNISAFEEQYSQVAFTVRPNRMDLGLFIGSLCFGVIGLFGTGADGPNKQMGVLTCLLFLFIVCPALLWMAVSAKRRLKRRFIIAFQLKLIKQN